MCPRKGDFVHDFRRFMVYCSKKPRPLFRTVNNLGIVVDTDTCDLGQISLLVSVFPL